MTKKKSLPLIIIAAVTAIAAVVAVVFNITLPQKSTPANVIKEGDFAVIPISEVSETATFYPVEVDGVSMELLAIKASDGTIRTAFNTCQSCHNSGKGFYVAEGTDLVCQNCGFHFNGDQVEVTAGGCNPYPIFEENKVITDTEIKIPYAFLSESKDLFSNWKTNS